MRKQKMKQKVISVCLLLFTIPWRVKIESWFTHEVLLYAEAVLLKSTLEVTLSLFRQHDQVNGIRFSLFHKTPRQKPAFP